MVKKSHYVDIKKKKTSIIIKQPSSDTYYDVYHLCLAKLKREFSSPEKKCIQTSYDLHLSDAIHDMN